LRTTIGRRVEEQVGRVEEHGRALGGVGGGLRGGRRTVEWEPFDEVGDRR
jgi:hypothetical protein